MTQTLSPVGLEVHERILVRVNALPETADRLLDGTPDDLRRDVDDVAAFLTGELIPHLAAAEETLYPELERMYQNRHSMSPMRREHGVVRRLVGEFATLTAQVDAGHVTLGRRIALRRVLFQLYALLKIHLAEERIYRQIVAHGGGADVGDLIAAAADHPGVRTA